MPYTQRGKNDCGIFALSYIESIERSFFNCLLSISIAYNALVDSDLRNFNIHILQNYSKGSYPRISRAEYVNIPDLPLNSMSIVSLLEKFNE